LKAIYLLIVLVSFTACKNESKKVETSVDAKTTKVNSKSFEMLQGTWVNIQDTLSTISFEGNTSKNSYNGVPNDRSIFFSIDNTCIANEIASTEEKDKYLNTTGAAEECYYLKTLNETTLELELVGKNMTLQFKRQ